MVNRNYQCCSQKSTGSLQFSILNLRSCIVYSLFLIRSDYPIRIALRTSRWRSFKNHLESSYHHQISLLTIDNTNSKNSQILDSPFRLSNLNNLSQFIFVERSPHIQYQSTKSSRLSLQRRKDYSLDITINQTTKKKVGHLRTIRRIPPARRMATQRCIKAKI